MANAEKVEGMDSAKGALLDVEFSTYQKALPELLARATGKFVLIKGDQVVDLFESQVDAIKQGYMRFSGEPFFVRQVEPVELTVNLNRFATVE